jgi:protein SCO1/2
MNRRKLGGMPFFASFLVACVLAAFAGLEPALAGAESYFPNVVLTTHDNKEVRFYDDLVKGKVVLINFMFTSCKRFCPVTTPNLVKVQAALGDRVGRDMFLYSITLDPATDTPEALRNYAKKVGAGPGWTFLTGKKETIDKLRRKLGVYDRNPVIDADITQHGGLVVYGNDAIGTWASISGLNKPEVIVRAVLRVAESGHP